MMQGPPWFSLTRNYRCPACRGRQYFNCWCQIASIHDVFGWIIPLLERDGIFAAALYEGSNNFHHFLCTYGAGHVRHYAGCPQSGCAGDWAGKVGQKMSENLAGICASVSHHIMMSSQQKLHQERLVRDKVVSSDAFQWQSMLKSYWVLNENNEANAQMSLAEVKRGPVLRLWFSHAWWNLGDSASTGFDLESILLYTYNRITV